MFWVRKCMKYENIFLFRENKICHKVTLVISKGENKGQIKYKVGKQ